MSLVLAAFIVFFSAYLFGAAIAKPYSGGFGKVLNNLRSHDVDASNAISARFAKSAEPKKAQRKVYFEEQIKYWGTDLFRIVKHARWVGVD